MASEKLSDCDRSLSLMRPEWFWLAEPFVLVIVCPYLFLALTAWRWWDIFVLLLWQL